jgi:hypothetical protein
MATQLITAHYGEMSVQFQENGFINATAIAKQFNKQPKAWLRLESTTEYIAQLIEFQRCENHTFDKNQLVIIKKGSPENGGGTWFHPKLAIPFARWLEARFAVWCDLQIEKILCLKTASINSDLAEIFLKPITKSLTPEDFEWRYQVLATAFQHLENATMVKTFKGSELLVGKRLVKSKRIF